MSKRDDIREVKARAKAEKAAKAMNNSQKQLKIQENKQTEEKKMRKKKEQEQKEKEVEIQEPNNDIKEEIPVSNETQNIESTEMSTDSNFNPISSDSKNTNELLETENVDVSSLLDNEKIFLGKLTGDKYDYGNDYDIKKMANALINSNGENRDNILIMFDKANDIKELNDDKTIKEDYKNAYDKIIDMICDELIDEPENLNKINSYDKDIKLNFINAIDKNKGLEQQMRELTEFFNKQQDEKNKQLNEFGKENSISLDTNIMLKQRESLKDQVIEPMNKNNEQEIDGR